MYSKNILIQSTNYYMKQTKHLIFPRAIQPVQYDSNLPPSCKQYNILFVIEIVNKCTYIKLLGSYTS